jgi:hypothetical protein
MRKLFDFALHTTCIVCREHVFLLPLLVENLLKIRVESIELGVRDLLVTLVTK